MGVYKKNPIMPMIRKKRPDVIILSEHLDYVLDPSQPILQYVSGLKNLNGLVSTDLYLEYIDTNPEQCVSLTIFNKLIRRAHPYKLVNRTITKEGVVSIVQFWEEIK